MRAVLVLAVAWVAAGPGPAGGGPYSPPAGADGSEAIPWASARLVGWAAGHAGYEVGAECDASFQVPERALGPAGDDVFDVVSLGRGGRITLRFDPPIADGPGADFAVFENAVTDAFLELAYVEVSSDGRTFVRFPCDSLTPAPVPAFGAVDASDVHGLAGTFAAGYGTPFDLADLPPAPGLDRGRVRWVRIIDVVGDGTCLDSDGDPVYDRYPTVLSAGFDLDAVGVVHQAIPVAAAAAAGAVSIGFPTAAGRTYQVECAEDPARPGAWADLGPPVAGDGQAHTVRHDDPPSRAIYRVRIRVEDPP